MARRLRRSSEKKRRAARAFTVARDMGRKTGRMAAEEDIAVVACREAELKVKNGKFSMPTGMLRKVFDRMSSVYNDEFDLSFKRVKDRVYSKLRKRNENVDDYFRGEESLPTTTNEAAGEEEEVCASGVALFVLVDLKKSCFVFDIASCLPTVVCS